MSWWRNASDAVRFGLGLVAAAVLLVVVVWVNFGPGDDSEAVSSPAPTLTMAAPGEPASPAGDSPTGPAGSSTGPSVAASADPTVPGVPGDPGAAGTPAGGDTASLPGEVELLKAELVEVASKGVVAFFEYGAGDATALDRLERMRPYIDDAFYDQLDESYDDPEFDAALEDGLWNTARVEQAEVGHNGDGVTPRITETGVMTVFVDIRQGWLPPGGELDARVHYLRMFEVSLIEGDDGIKIVDITPASI